MFDSLRFYYYLGSVGVHVLADALSAMDAKEVFEEIKEAKKKAFALGLKLKLPTGTRKRINSQSLSPDDRLLKTLEEYMKLQYPRPSWVGIVTALNSPIVGLPELANRIGESHCPGTSIYYYAASVTYYSYIGT